MVLALTLNRESRLALLQPCIRGMRQNLIPGFVLQLVALSLVVAYGHCDSVRAWLTFIGDAKERFGFEFSALSTAVFGGGLPFFVLLLSGRVAARHRIKVLCFYIGFWMWKGIEVDAFYRAQAYAFGNAATFAIIAKKTVVDQFIYNPLWAGPTQVLFFLWKDSDFAIPEVQRRLRAESLLRRIVVVLVSSWVVWIPTVVIVYALPAALQIPMFNLVICFWSLLLTSVGNASDARR
jgi:hypothetical protein